MKRFLNRRAVIAAFLLGGLVSAKIATASQKKSYKYRCPKCKLIQEYGSPGVKKCPNDGKTMVRQN